MFYLPKLSNNQYIAKISNHNYMEFYRANRANSPKNPPKKAFFTVIFPQKNHFCSEVVEDIGGTPMGNRTPTKGTGILHSIH